MKRFLLLAPTLAPLLHAGLIPLGEHVDIRCRWESGNWNCQAVTDSAGEVSHDPTTVFLPLSDKPNNPSNPAVSGARFTQPASSAFDFTGVDDGGPLWIAVQGSPGIGEAWPGFANNQTSVFGSYIPDDPRVSQTTARPWIRVSLVEHVPPHGKEAWFSLWNTSSGQPPKVWMSTFDPNVENSYYFTEGSHTHTSWGFSAQGIHKVRLRASAFAGPGATNPTGWSESFSLTFAVGTFARWQATWFDAAELDDPAISSAAADADADGWSNLLEYAFGTHPRDGGSAAQAPGLGMPVFSLVEDGGTVFRQLSYPKRRAASRIAPEEYRPLFAPSPAGPWSDEGVEITTSDFPAEMSALHVDWELATARLPLAEGESAGFARVAVTAGD